MLTKEHALDLRSLEPLKGNNIELERGCCSDEMTNRLKGTKIDDNINQPPPVYYYRPT